jgi:sugar O-acyltransferase (sialic acid O-acetyltransferase NeuD family)
MELALIGAGGFSNEVKAHMNMNQMTCFVEDNYFNGENNNIKRLSEFDPLKYKVLIVIGDGIIRKRIVNQLPSNTQYFSYIHPTAQILGDDVKIGEGSIICAGVIITTNCIIGKHSHLNLHTTIGHDNLIGDYFTAAPGVKISGNCQIGDCVYFGSNSSVKEKIMICDNVIIGLNAGVVKNITDSGVYVGVPANKKV